MRGVRSKREVKEKEPAMDTLRRFINILFTLAGIILLFRFVFLLFGANPNNQFVSLLYDITEPYVGIFSGIFPETEWASGVFEPATLIALVVLFIASWLVQSIFAKRTLRREEYVASHHPPEDNSSSEHIGDEADKGRAKGEKNEKYEKK